MQDQLIGPYELGQPLGQGGMGVVYRAQHRQAGGWVALKTVRLPQQNLLSGIRREIHSLARLRHPGIVRIIEEGLHEGLPWYAMELLEGATLRRWATQLPAGHTTSRTQPQGDWWTRTLATEPHTVVQDGSQAVPEDQARPCPIDPTSESVRRILNLVRALCSPLAYLHGEGLVHRDIKPDNILVRPGDWPVLMDFGLATPFAFELGREGLDHERPGLGTVAYMAPEQIRGELVDARADLYALGCILQELLTGQPPFVDRTTRGVLLKHLNQPPEPPSNRVPGLPAVLDQVVLRLLAKEPRHRFGHADAVAAALGSHQTPVQVWPEPPEARSYLYRPGFSGRHNSLAQLQQRLDRLDEGQGGLVLVGGESGVGKTRLVLEFAQKARRAGALVLSGEALARSAQDVGQAGGSALQCLRKPLQGIADRCREMGLAETDRLLGPRGKLLGLYESALIGLPGQGAYPEPAELPVESANLRLFNVLNETFAALASQPEGATPVVLILDDLQWADELTLGWLDHFRRLMDRNPGGMAFLVVGTYRSEELQRMSIDVLRQLQQAPQVMRLALGRLEDEAVASMVGDMLGLQPPPQVLSRFLSLQSEGNPFFVAETLRAAVFEGLLWRDGNGDWKAVEADYERLGLPQSLRQLVDRRLRGLPKAAAELVEGAAVMGRESDVSVLTKMLALDGDAAREAIAELLRRQVFEEARPGALRFTHDKLRELAYGDLDAQRKRHFHRAAAETMEELDQDQSSGTASLLGQHWELAEEKEKAAHYYLIAARKALAGNALAEAEHLFLSYLSLVSQPSLESIDVRGQLALGVLRLLGRTQGALEQATQALVEAEALGNPLAIFRTARNLGILYRDTGKVEEGKRLFEKALALQSADPGIRHELDSLLGSMANSLMVQGQAEPAQKLFLQAIETAQELGHLQNTARHKANLGSLYKDQGLFERALQLYEESLSLRRQIGDRRGEGITLTNYACLLYEQGHHAESVRTMEQALAILREVGDRRSEGNALTVLMDESNPLKSLHQYQAALEIHRETGNRGFYAVTLNYAASLERQLGRPDRGRTRLLEAAETHRQLGNLQALIVSTCLLGFLAIEEGQPAWEYLEQAQALASRIGNPNPQSGVGRMMFLLRGAIEAFEAGEHHKLFRGELIEGIPVPLRRWLVETGQLEASRAWPESPSSSSVIS